MNIIDFRERVMRLRPSGIGSLNGAGSGVIGSSSTAADTLMQLQRATIEFTRLYQMNDDEQLPIAKKEIIAKIMVAHAVDAITEQQADELVAALQQLIKERK